MVCFTDIQCLFDAWLISLEYAWSALRTSSVCLKHGFTTSRSYQALLDHLLLNIFGKQDYFSAGLCFWHSSVLLCKGDVSVLS